MIGSYVILEFSPSSLESTDSNDTSVFGPTLEDKNTDESETINNDVDVKIKELPKVSELPEFIYNPKQQDTTAFDIETTEPEMISQQYPSHFRGSRASMGESEPNNNFESADLISQTPMDIVNAELSLDSPSDAVDFYMIMLEGEDDKVDNLTVKVTQLNSLYDWSDYFYLSIYGVFEDKYLHMKTLSIYIWDWNGVNDLSPAHINAFASDYYYIRVSVINDYGYPTEVNYELEVTTQRVTAPDDNQVADYAQKISRPLFSQSLRMDKDIFDWYYVESPDPDNYETNFSITVDITASLPVKTLSSNAGPVSFVTEVHLLVYEKTPSGKYNGEEVVGNMHHKFGQPDPIFYYQWTKKTETYVGLYVQCFGRTSDGEGEYVFGEGYCDGWVNYDIKKLQAKPMIPPVLSDASVFSPIGKIYNTFVYTVNYSDENNDKPKQVTITIDNGDIGPEPMTKVDKSDMNYIDGATYQYVIDGTEYDPEHEEEHTYWIFAEDAERKAEGLNRVGPIITENILPTARPSASTKYTIYEDDPISYIDLNTTFEDIDNDILYYRLSDNNQNWSNIYISNNISIKVVSIEDKNYLEFKPKKNMFNRVSGQKFGSEIVYINVSDDDPENPKHPNQYDEISRAHYILNTFELEVIIISVNDPPEIRIPFESQPDFPYGELIIPEDSTYRNLDLTSVFWDPVENDPLTFTVENNKNVNVVFFANGSADIVPVKNWYGVETIEIRANDGFATISDSLKVTVAPVNDDPILNYTPKQEIFEDEWFNYTFGGYDDIDNDQVYFETNIKEKLNLPENDFSFNTLTGEISFKPGNDNVGTYKDIQITVKDYNGGIASQNVVFEIHNKPDPPEPKIISPVHGARFLDTERISFQGEFNDPDDKILVEPHTFQWHSNIMGNLTKNPSFKIELLAGEHTITFTVSDPIFNKSQSILILVLSVNDLDTDEDGIPDYWEKLHYLNHLDPQDAKDDPDKDTFSNWEEYLGLDGKPGSDDDTDPHNSMDHPVKHIEILVEEESSLPLITSVTAIIITIIIILLILFLVIRKKRKKEEEAVLDKKPEEEIIWRDIYGRKYKKYEYEPYYIMCHNCLNRIEIQIPLRPLVITCPKCNKRGVLYK